MSGVKHAISASACLAALLAGAGCGRHDAAPPAEPAAPTAAPVSHRAPAPQRLQMPAGPPQDVEWFALVPRDWEPVKTFNDDVARLQDNDPKAMEALEKLRAAWADAPVEPSMDGQRIRIGGYMVPLDGEGEATREFLLVPYFGACIHAPPPPANQVIHVFADRPVTGIRMMDPVYVTGTLRVARERSPASVAGLIDAIGYAMRADAVTLYEVPR